MDKEQVAAILLEIGILLELKGENPFKTRAYSNAAKTLESLSEPIDVIVREDRLGQVKGIGEGLQKKITELIVTGKLAYYDELKASMPAGLMEMLQIPGLGPKKVKALYEHLRVATIDELEQVCTQGKVAALDGFGDKTQAKIIEGIKFRRSYASKHLLIEAILAAEPILEALRNHPGVIRCSTAGSVRRHKETIGDIDFLASSKQPAETIDDFTRLPGILSVSAKGDTKASVILAGGIQADLRVVSDAEFPFALAYFTGSKEHNIVMRQRAIHRGLRLNEYGLFRSDQETRDPQLLVACRTEEDIFTQLGLSFIPPELREDHGEFQLSESGQIPRLIEWTDLKGSLHNHSNWSDGHHSLHEIASYMEELGCAYWAITDHSQASVQTHGLDELRLRQQIQEISEVNKRLADDGSEFRLLTGTEVDILTGGKLDLPQGILAELDVVIASLHQGFSQKEAENTEKLIRAAQHPCIHMIGHLTGRLLLEREPYPVNQHAVIDACAETGTWIELNSHPSRFDMDWRLWAYAKSKGVKCVINCDAHRNDQAGFLRLGAGIARKGGLSAKDVINCLPLHSLREALKAKKIEKIG